MMRNLLIGDDSWVGNTPTTLVMVSLNYLASQLARFESAGASTFSFNHGDATGTQGIDVCSVKVC